MGVGSDGAVAVVDVAVAVVGGVAVSIRRDCGSDRRADGAGWLAVAVGRDAVSLIASDPPRPSPRRGRRSTPGRCILTTALPPNTTAETSETDVEASGEEGDDVASNRWRRWYASLVFWPTLGWNALLGRWLGRRRWWDRVDANLIVGAYPFVGDVSTWTPENVTGVVNTCEEYAGPIDRYAAHNIEQLHIPTTDFTHPRIADVRRAVEFIDRHADAGGTVYVHCKAGRARSATVAMAWLMKRHGMTPEEAQRVLLERRPHINPAVHRRRVIRQLADEYNAESRPPEPNDVGGGG